jgi:SAGA-associated factor 73
VDVDRQCGVINDKGLPCSRALTCKSHAMGAKRAVEGRSKPYDELLLEWNRAHKPNFVEPVKRQSKEEKKLLKEKEKKEKAALKAKEKEEAVKAALANGEKVPKKYSKSGTAAGSSGSLGQGGTGGTSTHGGGGGGGSAKKKGKVEFSIDPSLEEERVTMDDMEQQIEVDRLVSAVRTIRQSGYGAMPLAVPNDARLYFLKRREVVVSSRDLLTQALQGWSVKA